ncbi:MAG: transcription termination factor Rho [Lachnospiraceae bacterium]|nr:transcription termination factor Rho [Lachnospiraceae bacterium]
MDFESMSLTELRAYAKEHNIKGVTALRKSELIERLQGSSESKQVNLAEKESANAEIGKVDSAGNEKNESVGTTPERKQVYERNNYERSNYERSSYENNRYPRNEGGSSVRPQRMVRSNDSQRGYQSRPQGSYQPRQGYSQYSTQTRYDNSQYNSQSRYNQENSQGSFQPRYNQENAQSNSQVRNVQENAQQGYQPRNSQESGQTGYQPRYNQENTGTVNIQEPVYERIYQDTGISREGVLELVKTEGYGFIRCDNFLPGENDVYVSPTQIRKFNLKTGDWVKGNLREKNPTEKYQGLAFIEAINGESPDVAVKRPKFEELTPIFPHERIHFETPKCSSAMRLVDILSPVGKGQRGMIVSQPKAGKTTLLKQIANAITINHPEMKIIILLIDERPEEVTDIKESIVSDNVEVIYSTFDELPENHKRVSEMVIERAKRLVEHGQDVCILLDSITRLARAYNLTVTNSGRTLSGGLDPAALHMPKKFFGAARCMREGGSLTILATALVDTGSRMDDVVFEEFKGTGNMELVLDRSLSEKRIFPAIDLPKSGTRREDLLLSQEELEASFLMRNALNGAKSEEAIEIILNYLKRTANNAELVDFIRNKGIFVK